MASSSSDHYDYVPTVLSHDASNMIHLDLSSSEPLPETDGAASGAAAASSRRDSVSAGGLTFWLDGDALMCACPDCGAPVSVRLWLMSADCWHCQSAIEVSEEVEREARTLLNRPAAERPMAPPRPAARPPAPPPPAPGPPAPDAEARRRASRAATPVSARLAAADDFARWAHDRFKETPAWIVSLVIHAVVLALLSLLAYHDSDPGPTITLSTEVAVDRTEGGKVEQMDPEDEVVFDLPIPEDINLTNEKQRRAMILADQEAKQLRLDPDLQDPNLPNLNTLKRNIGAADVAQRSLLARDPRLRAEIVKREGGTTLTEAAVARGLRWLAAHQSSDGSWSLHDFHRAGRCNCGGRGNVRSDSAGTSLALLAFLGAGQTHLTGMYKDNVARALRWLVDQQRDDGDLSGSSRGGNAMMYAHGQGAIVLCEAFAMTWDESLRKPSQRAIDFIAAAQHSGGGWRYRPGERGDTSVVGWQLMALQSARAADLEVPEETLELAGHYLDSVRHSDGVRYAYMRGRRPSKVMTAEALLCRMYLGWTLTDNPSLVEGVQHLTTRENLPASGHPNIYYWYYATQTLHHAGGERWERWNDRMKDILVDTQEVSGHEAGSWSPRGDHAGAGGRVYMTSLAVCSLEVYYRHAPIFRRIDLD